MNQAAKGSKAALYGPSELNELLPSDWYQYNIFYNFNTFSFFIYVPVKQYKYSHKIKDINY
jgi:hypothetical protein